jgi:hypothetical protein
LHCSGKFSGILKSLGSNNSADANKRYKQPPEWPNKKS